MNKNDECIEGFHCVEFSRKVKDKISAELNAMTHEEQLLYFERINAKAEQKRREREQAKLREREQANSSAT